MNPLCSVPNMTVNTFKRTTYKRLEPVIGSGRRKVELEVRERSAAGRERIGKWRKQP